MAFIAQANKYIESQAPWKLAKETDKTRLHAVLHVLVETIRTTAVLLEPFMPSVSAEIWRQIGYASQPRRFAEAARWPAIPDGQAIADHPVLFPKPEAA